MDSYYDRNLDLDGWLLTEVAVVRDFFKRVSVIDNDFSDGDTCVFKASTLPDKPNIPEVSCTINSKLLQFPHFVPYSHDTFLSTV